jgi:tryptophan 2,3-dioxygenase
MSLTYGRYLKVPELLALQECRSQPRHHDETLFIVIHQVYELWFKQVLHEIDHAALAIRRGELGEGARLLRRVVEIQRLLVHQVRVLETMRPQDFLGFREVLNPASGFQSVQFRELEFALGMKDPRVMQAIDCNPDERARLEARLGGPTLMDAVDEALRARGARLDRPDARLDAVVAAYEAGEAQADLVALFEVMIEIDECLALWRFHHVQMVERMIGARRGTGGSDGVGYLSSTLSKRGFPELWQARTRLGGEPEGGAR